MGIANIQTWEHFSAYGSISRDDFVISHDCYPHFYTKARERAGQYGEPIEQLSPKGIAVLLHILAEKEQHANQPVIASDIASLKHVTTIVDNSEPGVGVELYNAFQLSILSTAHKVTIKLVKTTDGINIIHMDGTPCPQVIRGLNILIGNALLDNSSKQAKSCTKMISFEPTFPENPDPCATQDRFFRQTDGYQCGIFSIKDARMFAKGEHPDVTTNCDQIRKAPCELGWLQANYKMPTGFFKSMQSRTFREYIQSEDKQYDLNSVINPRTGRSLADIYRKYATPASYTRKFSDKYLKAVEEYIRKHSIQEIRTVVEKYDAGQLTVERLKEINIARLKQQAAGGEYAKAHALNKL